MSDHKEIWLMPECCADPAEGRLWCEQDEPTSCEDGVPWTRYVRADLHDALAARLAETEAGYIAAVQKAQWQASTNRELNQLRDELAATKARLNAEENAHAELQARCFDQGSQSVFDAVREAQARLAEAERLLKKHFPHFPRVGVAEEVDAFLYPRATDSASACSTCNGTGKRRRRVQDGTASGDYWTEPCPDCRATDSATVLNSPEEGNK